MFFTRYLYRNISILNILLFITFILLIIFILLPLFKIKVKYVLPAVKVKAAAQEEAVTEKPEVSSPVDFAMIGENNLFHPERKTPKEEKVLPRPELVLYGTILSQGMNIAYVEDRKAPRSTPGRGKRPMAAKKGDSFGGFVLTTIEPNRIVLMKGEERMVVPLVANDKQRGGDTAAPAGKAHTPPTVPGSVVMQGPPPDDSIIMNPYPPQTP